ncbi:hypothetical protein YN1HA_18600 [Sulfurisphaera ohwakuensis]
MKMEFMCKNEKKLKQIVVEKEIDPEEVKTKRN